MRLAGRAGRGGRPQNDAEAGERGAKLHIFPACGAKKSRLATLADLIKQDEVMVGGWCERDCKKPSR